MRTVFTGFIGCVLIAGLLFVSERYAHTRQALASAQRLAEAAQQGNLERDAVIHTLREQIRRHEQALAELQAQRTRIQTTHGQRITWIQQQQHEHPTFQTWANTPLPDVLIRLRDHPAFTRAADYRFSLSARDSLHAARCGADHQRRIKPGAGSG